MAESSVATNQKDIPSELTAMVNKLMRPEGYLWAGFPRFCELFGRDALITSLQLMRFNTDIPKNSIMALAKLQGNKSDPVNGEEPGKIIHEYYDHGVDAEFIKYKSPIGWLKPFVPVYFSIDSTPLFLITISNYYNVKKDKRLLDTLMPNILASINFIINSCEKDGMLKYNKLYNGSSLQSQSWKDGIGNLTDNLVGPVAVVEVQGYAYMALKSMVPIIRDEGFDGLSDRMDAVANRIKEAFNKSFWDAGNEFYHLAIDGHGKKLDIITSNPGHLLFTGIIDKEHADKVVKRLFKSDMLTPYGIRTHSEHDKNFDEYAYQRGSVWIQDNWIIAQGLKNMGYMQEYNTIRECILKLFRELKSAPEYIAVSRSGKIIPPENLPESSRPCDPQAWTIGAIADFLVD